ncbi:protein DETOXIFICATION 49-like [Coffea arabica]|uniref:Protein DETOXIFICATION n=1 Tax=Coffea arabica TaxID=13443 RepID=A0A6P6T9K7_COFAR|nr:protein DETOXIFICATION 49-like [Coffea arabica]
MAVETSAPLLVDYINGLPKSNESFPDHEHHGSRPTLPEVAEEIKKLYTIAFPMIITGLLVYGKSMISVLFMGRMGKDALAGGSLSSGIANITGYSIISGLAMGMEGISSQACGAKQWSVMGQTLQRTIVILLFASIPISLLWLNIQPILVFCGQDSNISSVAANHLAFCIPDLVFQSIIYPLKIFLRTQNVTLPLILSAVFSLALHAPVNYLLIHKLGLGIRGVAAASSITDFATLATLVLYIIFSGVYKRSWPGWSLQCFNQWKPILSLALPSCVSVCLEWWWYELMILLSGLLSNAAEVVATMGILLQATSLVYIFPSSLGLAVSTRVGNELGANHPSKARISCLVALACAVFTSIAAMSFVTICRNAWGRAFTQDKAILSLTALSMPVVGLCELGNCPQTAGCGVLKGCARPVLGATINLGSFYGVGLPLAIITGFGLGKGLLGLWLGLLVAQAVCSVLMVFVLRGTDWMDQANRASELIGITGDPDRESRGEYVIWNDHDRQLSQAKESTV